MSAPDPATASSGGASAAPGDVVVGEDGRGRCRWGASDPEYRRYHDEEWGTPLHGDRALFEKLVLEGFQAGLSWITILRKRPAFREVFHGFDIHAVANLRPADADSLMLETRIVRNRAKIEATITNARVVRDLVRDDEGAFDRLMWSFAPPSRGHVPATFAEVPAVTPESAALSSTLKKLGMRFVGPTTMYALMQSSGMVDDHVVGCWRAADGVSP